MKAGCGASLEKLLRIVMEYRMFSGYRMTPSCVELERGTELTMLDPEEARLYLLGLVRGYEAGLHGSFRYLRRAA